MDIYKIIGIFGLLLISTGVLTQKKNEDLWYIFGGTFLLVYSVYIEDYIFIVLQIVFTLSAIYHFTKLKFKK
ncbi:hypothetical protein C0580_01985 [Candidatus Parcubacteria bacterium]|nr:MAG: hypothetical protein C0580_01985 [Candidatus Parcubacteria bacterium]